MALDLVGPRDETPLQAIERLIALKKSLKYAGGGYYEDSFHGAGCTEDDMADLNTEVAYAVMEALPAIREMQAAQSHLSNLLSEILDDGCMGLNIASLNAVVFQLHLGIDNGGLERPALANTLGAIASRLTSIHDVAGMEIEVAA